MTIITTQNKPKSMLEQARLNLFAKISPTLDKINKFRLKRLLEEKESLKLDIIYTKSGTPEDKKLKKRTEQVEKSIKKLEKINKN